MVDSSSQFPFKVWAHRQTKSDNMPPAWDIGLITAAAVCLSVCPRFKWCTYWGYSSLGFARLPCGE